ncbi:MAG: ABC transporter ATP-binding protein [Candidatus Brocadiaceae bacterium]|nr:ABC transporter ATP-binding protein [Candidatus Brocadiaceae bacterium]
MALAEFQNVWRTYQMGETLLHAMRGVNFAVEEGEMVAIMGPSGSGKSTLLNLLGCLDTPTSGRYLLGGRDISTLSDDELSDIRASEIGFVFQSYNLIAQLNVVENIEIPLYYQGMSERESYRRAVEMAEVVGLSHRLTHVPTELSGGERQRVGIARALASSPLFVLADEPTGNLDTRTGEQILELLGEVNGSGVTMIIVTHDPRVAERAQRTLHLVDGQITEDLPQPDKQATP